MSKHTADFNQLSNDLYWKFYGGEDGFIRWTGYDDEYWWNNVSLSDNFKQKIGKITGRIFELNAETREVAIYQPAAAALKETGDE